MSEPEETYGYDAERQRLRRLWNELEAERAKLGDIRTGAVDPVEREREIDEAMDGIEFELGMIEQQDKQPAQREPVRHGGWALTTTGRDVAEALRQMFSQVAGRDVSFEELEAALDAMRRELGERQVDEMEALRLLVAKLKHS